jgi:nucleotide-binding universal stress UspA family protein
VYNKILVPVDGSSASTSGLLEAIKVAKNQNSALCLVHVVNEYIVDYDATGSYYMRDKLIEAMRDNGKAILEKASSLVQKHGLKPDSVLLESIGGSAASLILQQANAAQVDLIVMGTHGRRGLRRLTLGSDAELVVRGATVPVLLVRSVES